MVLNENCAHISFRESLFGSNKYLLFSRRFHLKCCVPCFSVLRPPQSAPLHRPQPPAPQRWPRRSGRGGYTLASIATGRRAIAVALALAINLVFAVAVAVAIAVTVAVAVALTVAVAVATCRAAVGTVLKSPG